MSDETRTDQPAASADEATRRQPLIVEGGRAWSVESGGVDLFATRLGDGEATGERRHLFRLAAGSVLLGVGLSRTRDRVGLQAVPLQGCRLRPLDPSQVPPDAVDGWVQAVSSCVAAPLPSRLDHLLTPGTDLALAEGATAHAGRAVAWVRQPEGACLLGGLQTIRTSAEGWIPVTARTWLKAEGAGRVEVIDTAGLLARDPSRESVGRFQRACIACIEEQLEADAALARRRLERRLAADDAAMRSAVGELAGVLSRPGEEGAVGKGGNALVRACELVGGPMGITVRAPRRLGDRAGRDALVDIARASRVRTRRVMLRGDWWHQDNGPLLGWGKEDGRPVALLPDERLRYEVVDPATGETTRLSAAVADTLEPWADSLYTPFPTRALRAADLLAIGLSNCRRRDLVRILVVGGLAGALGMAPAIATGIVFDSVIPSGQPRLLAHVALALLVMVIAGTLFHLTRSLTVLRVEAKTAAAVQAGVWDRLLGLPVSFFRRYLSGDLAVRSLGIDAIRQVITGVTLSSLLSGVFSIFSFGLLFYYDPWLAVLASGLVVVAGAVVAWLSYRELKFHRGLQRIGGEVSALVLQLVGGIAKLRVAAAEERGFAVFSRRFGEQKQLAVNAGKVSNWLAVFDIVFPTLATMVLFAAVAPAPGAKGEPLSTASFLAFYAAFGQFLTAGLQMGAGVIQVLQVVPIYERAKPILETLPEVDSAKASPGEIEGRIELSHVSFRYRPGGPLVLRDVSLQARAGELVAIVGPSGAGKSTVMRLVLGFESPESGSVQIDGKDLASLDVQAVRRQMGVVLQNGQLLPGSLFENIVGASTLTVEDAWAAARMAGLAADIEAMPMGMHTYIPEGGSTLSGGQRQRLLIARAVVARPRILLFDEATSALDNLTQAQVTASLEGLRATRIVIAHRLSTVMRADRIYFVDGGRVVQAGTHDELIGQPGPFAELARRQIA